MSQKPSIGRVVIFNLNDDGCPSPATIIRTKATTSPEIPLPAGVPLLEETEVDLLVHGLLRDYRKHGVPFSDAGVRGSWTWPERV